nr:protein PRR14L [Pogona vitticeps]
MSAVVQEPYSGLPSTHAAEHPALSDPVGVFRAKPEASAFVLTCSGLPSEHQRTHGLKGRRQNYPERLDCAGKLPCPGLMDLLPKEPVETGGLVEDNKTPGWVLTKQDSLRDCPREGLGGAEGMAGVAVESLVPFSQTARDACCSEEKEPRLAQEGKDFPPSPSSTERAAELQNLEEDPAKVQVAPESLSKPMLETQGMTADGTGLFSKTGEDGTRGSTGISPESNERSDLDTVHAKVAVSGVSTLVSLEPFTLLDNASPAEGQLPEEKEWEDLTASAPSSAARKVLSSSRGGEDKLLGQEEPVCAISSGGLPAQQDEMNFHDAASTAPVAESKAPFEGSGASALLFESNLELGMMMLWEEGADVQVVCEVQTERLTDSDENFSCSSCEKIKLLEEWASEPKIDESLWQTGSSDELSSDGEDEQGMESCADHAYSCLWRRIPEPKKVAPVQQSSREDVQEGPPSEDEGSAALPRRNSTNPESGLPLLQDDVHSSTEEEEGQGSSGSRRIEKEEGSPCPPPPRGGGLVIGVKEERTLLEEAKSCGCFQNSFSARSDSYPSSSSSSSGDSSGPGSELNEGDLLETESSSSRGTDLLERASVAQRPVVDVSFTKDEKHSEATLFSGELSLTQEEDIDFEGPEFTDSLLKGDPSGTCAKLVTQNTNYFLQNKEDLSSACHDGGCCLTANGNLEYTGDVTPGDAGKRAADVGRARSGAHNPGEQSRSNLCSAVEICRTRSGDVSSEAQTVGAQAGREDGSGLEISHSSVPAEKATLPWACGAGVPGALPACEGSLDGSNGAEPTPNAVCPAGPSPPGLSAAGAAESCAEAKAQRTDGGESVTESEGIPDGNSGLFAPIANLQQEPGTDDSMEFESDGPDMVETVRTEGGGQGRALAGKPAQDRDVDETALCELARLVNDRSKEESEGNPNPPTFPSASHLSNLEPRLDPCCPDQAQWQGCSLLLVDLHHPDPDQPRKTAGQQETQNGHPHSPTLFHQKNKSLETASLSECSPLPLMFSERQNGDPGISTVTHSAEEAQKQASCHQNEPPGPQKTQDLTLPASKLLLEKDVQETFQPNTIGSSDKTVPELNGNLWKKDPKELENSKLCLGSLENLSRTPKWPQPVQDQPYQVKTEEFCSVPAAVGGDPSNVPDQKPSLKCNSKPASPPGQTCFQPDLPTFILLEDQRSTEGVDAESFRNKKRSNLAAVQPLQTPGSWLSQRDGPFSLPASKAPSSPRVEEHPSGTFSAESKADDQVNLVISEKAHIRFSVKEAACVDSALAAPETGLCSVGDKQRTGGIVLGTPKRSPDPTLKETELSLEEVRRVSSPPTDTKDSLGVPVQSLPFPVGTEERTFPLEEKIEIRTPWVSLQECASERGGTQAKDPSKSTENLERHEENRSYAWQLFPKRNSPEILSRSITLAFRDSRLSGAPTPCLRREGRCLQAAGASREPAGEQKKLLPESPSGSHATEAPVKTGAPELGGGPKPTAKALEQEAEPTATQAGAACGGLSQWNRTGRKVGARGFLRRTILATGPLFGSSSLRRRVKPGDLGHQALPRRSLWSSRGSGTPSGPLREPGRPKGSADFMELRPMEGGSPKLGFREPLRPSEDKTRPLPVSCVLSKSVGFSGEGSRRAFESACRRKPTLLFRRHSERGPALGKFKAPKEGRPRPSPASLKNPRPGIKPMGAPCSATALAAPRSERAVTWDCAPKPRGSRSTRLDPFGLGRRAKDPPLLRKLSKLADKLLVPSRNPRKFKPLLHSSELLPMPEKYNHLGSQKLPEMFSCVSIKLNAPWMNSSGGCFRMFHSQPVGFYPIESTKVCCFFGLDSKAPLAFCTPVFPVSFHIQMDPSPTRNLLGSPALLSISQRATSREVPTWQASGWTFSFLLSPSCLNVAPIQKDAQSSSLSAIKALVGDAIAQNLRGLQTVLALLSPGCSRLWAKKRRLARRSPCLPKPMLLPFAQEGLKGFRKGSPSGPADLFSSVPPSLGRALSTWNRQGLSPGPSELPPLLSTCYKWQPVPAAAAASLSLRNSSATLPPLPDQFLEASAAVTEDARWEPPFPAFLPTPRPVAEPAPSRLGLSAPEFQAHRLDELDASAPMLPRRDSPLEKAESEKRPKRVSQIRIRKTIPKPDPNLTPMGLPRPKRLKKTEFSLEEIYTNQNYKSPPPTRCLETIFEEPKERNGSLVSISHQKRKRILEFQDFTVPRKRKVRGRVKVTGSFTRAQKAAVEGRELDVLLIQKLTDLETFFAKQEEQRDAPGS